MSSEIRVMISIGFKLLNSNHGLVGIITNATILFAKLGLRVIKWGGRVSSAA